MMDADGTTTDTVVITVFAVKPPVVCVPVTTAGAVVLLFTVIEVTVAFPIPEKRMKNDAIRTSD